MIEERVAIAFMAHSLCSFLLTVCIGNPESLLSPVNEACLSSLNTSGPIIANFLEDQPHKSQFVLISTFPLESIRNNDSCLIFLFTLATKWVPNFPGYPILEKEYLRSWNIDIQAPIISSGTRPYYSQCLANITYIL